MVIPVKKMKVIFDHLLMFVFCLQNKFLKANSLDSFNSPLRFWLAE